jgi:hypothetical protein
MVVSLFISGLNDFLRDHTISGARWYRHARYITLGSCIELEKTPCRSLSLKRHHASRASIMLISPSATRQKSIQMRNNNINIRSVHHLATPGAAVVLASLVVVSISFLTKMPGKGQQDSLLQQK